MSDYCQQLTEPCNNTTTTAGLYVPRNPSETAPMQFDKCERDILKLLVTIRYRKAGMNFTRWRYLSLFNINGKLLWKHGAKIEQKNRIRNNVARISTTKGNRRSDSRSSEMCVWGGGRRFISLNSPTQFNRGPCHSSPPCTNSPWCTYGK
jgi:hypothetical protein